MEVTQVGWMPLEELKVVILLPAHLLQQMETYIIIPKHLDLKFMMAVGGFQM
jgi:hypothetical protein